MADGLYAAIAQGGQPIQIENPLNQMAKAMAVKNAMAESQLNALKLTEAQQDAEARNALAELARSGIDLKSPEARKKAYEISPTFGMKFEKSQAELEKSGLETRKLKGEVTAQDLKASRERLNDLYVNPSNENILAHLQDDIIKGLIAPDKAAAQWQRYSAMSPEARKNEFLQLKMGVDEYAKQNKPHLTSQDLGGSTRILATPGLGGPATVVPGSMAAKGLTPEQARTAAQESKVVAHTITDEAGNITQINKFGQVITPTTAEGAVATIKGKPSATFEKAKAQREQLSKDLDTAIFELKGIAKPGGLIDQSTGSYIGKAVDIGARVFGQATPGDIASAKLKPIADLVLKMVPRFEGPQSDKDTQSYKEAAGQLADMGMPREVRKAAANTIIRLMENRKNQFVSTDMAAEGTKPAGAGAAPIYAKNPSTGERIMSLDGGNTWNPAR